MCPKCNNHFRKNDMILNMTDVSGIFKVVCPHCLKKLNVREVVSYEFIIEDRRVND